MVDWSSQPVAAPTFRQALDDLDIHAMLMGSGIALWENYKHAILFTTCEPCPMCLGAAVMADVPHIIFAAHDEVVHSRQTVAFNPYVRRHIRSYYGGVLEAEARALIARFNPAMLAYITSQRQEHPTRAMRPHSAPGATFPEDATLSGE